MFYSFNYTIKITWKEKPLNIYRFVDNLCAINGHLEFGTNFKDIYPSELEPTEENIPSFEISLDLSTDTEYNKFKTKLNEKRDALPFHIFRNCNWTVIFH